MGRPHQSEGHEERPPRQYRKECSLYIDVKDNKVVKPRPLIEAIQDLVGEGTLYACIAKSGNLYEVTVSHEIAAAFLEGGVTCEGVTYDCTPVINDKLLVSILEIPTYVEDVEIEKKLKEMDVDLVTPINRKCYSGTTVEDGTRMCTVKLPNTLRSLPYMMKLSDGVQANNYRVVHDNQVKMCHNCYSTSHMYRDCPEVECFRCKSRGHFKWQCKAQRCGYCYKFTCVCKKDEQDERSEQDERDGMRDETTMSDTNGDDTGDDDNDDDKDKTDHENKGKNDNHDENSDDENNDHNTTDNNNDEISDDKTTDDTNELRETVFGDFLGAASEIEQVLRPHESPITHDKNTNNDSEITNVEMSSPKRQRKRAVADDSRSPGEYKVPEKFRVHSPVKNKC